MNTHKPTPHPVKFLIIRFSSIGDIIQCMGIISGIKNRFPEAEIHWITRKDMSSFLAMDRRISKIWAFDKTEGLSGLWRMAGELRRERFDYIYDAHSNIRSNILKIRILSTFTHRPAYGLRRKERIKRFLLFRFHINKFPWPFRGSVSYQKPLEKWGIIHFESTYNDWHFPAEYTEKFKGLIGPRTVTLVPSANWPKKRWPISHWISLIHLLPDYRFLILAGPADTFCETIRQAAPERVLNLAGKTSLLESCYLVNQSSLIVSADTGFMHAADLFGRKTLALMGPTAFGFPSGPNTEILEKELPCRPCTKDGSGKCIRTIYQECMVGILPQQVAERIKAYFEDSPS